MKNYRAQRQWNTKAILQQIRELESLSAKACQKSHSSLYGAAIRYFGSWKGAVESADIDYKQVLQRKSPGYWNDERVISEIQNLLQKNSGFARKNNPALYSAAIRLFTSWQQAVESAGFKYENIRKT